MNNVHKIGVLLIANYWLVNGISVTDRSLDSFHSANLPSRRYLPAPSQPLFPNHSGRGDIDAYSENDPRVVPLGGQDPRKQYRPTPRENPRKSITEPRSDNSIKLYDVRNINNLAKVTGLPFLRDTKETTNTGQSHRDVSQYGAAKSPAYRIITTENSYLKNSSYKQQPTTSSVSRVSRYYVHENISSHSSKSLTGETLRRDESVKPIYERNQYLPNDNYNHRTPSRINGETGYLDHREPNQVTQSLNFHHPSHADATLAISTIKSFLDTYSNNDSYNSELHLPTNPVLALVLSHYGKYAPGARGARVYSYMATNNIHNNKPFGSYKLNREEDPN